MPVSRELLIGKASREFRRFFRRHSRVFPWRQRGTTPFGILVAEMLLRQTRATQVAEVWPTLIERYPGPGEVARADPEELYALLLPLGLGRQRAEALREMSTALIERHGGRVPRKVESLYNLPHVGLYSAHATACFAFGQRVALVDVNVIRVLSRLFGVTLKPDNRRAPEAWRLAEAIMPTTGPAKEHHYGLLDFAALICTPGKPLCRECPLNKDCAWCWTYVWSNVDFNAKPPDMPPWPR